MSKLEKKMDKMFEKSIEVILIGAATLLLPLLTLMFMAVSYNMLFIDVSHWDENLAGKFINNMMLPLIKIMLIGGWLLLTSTIIWWFSRMSLEIYNHYKKR